ncbi:alcohol dehydrogenase catalytic domain-containing protein [Mediterraneibacter sp. NSJ-55]|uniref:Alcohol dehydrogenase catalytic domain-containing protein n=1 Tax=Mediterraneibacter hominis TaxID=2763054 RepID=A0A923LJ20_9FIRM|nr:alcohol dehydrogenase catalytic domain-containing protein [Mediterraneibacter hominis]MBC5689164.1 alcohol dehydrogenase catalytic domain-containing protein [Mediterraneibacter hominis]
METYKVAVIEDVKKIGFKEVKKREPEDRQVLVKVDSCAICTLEQRVYSGVMNRYPFAGGHEAAGTVEAIGKKVKGVQVGDKVAVRLLNSCGECYYCRNGHENQCTTSFIAETQECAMGPGGFAEYMMMDASDVYKMDPKIDLTHAALSEPLACCVHSIENGQIGLGDDVVVIGVGIMGALHIQLAKLKGARVIACELDDTRLEIAKKMGADILINSGKTDPVKEIQKITEGRGADAVFCTVPVAALAKQAVDMSGKLGRIVFYTSFHPDNPIDISPNKVHSTEQIITGTVNPMKKDFLIATRLLSGKLIDVSALISDCIPLENIEEAMEKAIRPDTYRIIVRP